MELNIFVFRWKKWKISHDFITQNHRVMFFCLFDNKIELLFGEDFAWRIVRMTQDDKLWFLLIHNHCKLIHIKLISIKIWWWTLLNVDRDLFEWTGNNFSFERLNWLHVKGVNRSEHKNFLLLLCKRHDTTCDKIANRWAFNKVLS